MEISVYAYDNVKLANNFTPYKRIYQFEVQVEKPLLEETYLVNNKSFHNKVRVKRLMKIRDTGPGLSS